LDIDINKPGIRSLFPLTSFCSFGEPRRLAQPVFKSLEGTLMGDVSYKSEGSWTDSISSFVSGAWDEVSSIPGNVIKHYRDNPVTAIVETLLPPLLIIDAEVRAHNEENGPLNDSGKAVKKMFEDSILKGNTSTLNDLMIMHSGDPTALNKIMKDVEKDLEQFGVKLEYTVDDAGKGQLKIKSDRNYVNMSTDGTKTFGEIRDGNEQPARQGSDPEQAMRGIASDAQQYVQKRFNR
jgi:hypothetical protein